ncbi:MAG TPA: nucleotidyltransferase domain-containing protein [Gryllotalpicola sp.]
MTATHATPESLDLRELLHAHRDQLQAVLDEYRAVNPRVFGSVARGEAGPDSDIDLLVDLLPDDRHSDLIRVGGLRAGFRRVLDQDVDVVASQLLKARVSATALKDAVPL